MDKSSDPGANQASDAGGIKEKIARLQANARKRLEEAVSVGIISAGERAQIIDALNGHGSVTDCGISERLDKLYKLERAGVALESARANLQDILGEDGVIDFAQASHAVQVAALEHLAKEPRVPFVNSRNEAIAFLHITLELRHEEIAVLLNVVNDNWNEEHLEKAAAASRTGLGVLRQTMHWSPDANKWNDGFKRECTAQQMRPDCHADHVKSCVDRHFEALRRGKNLT